ncbi:MAG: hypothetical protein WC778_11015 [Negativicutes bacterium]|jgi:hypothetical protein
MINVRITVDGINRLRFDKRELKAAFRKGGAVVRKEARRLIASRAVSSAGSFPGYNSGAMSRSIKVKVGSGGGYVRVMPTKTSEMGADYYPAFLMVGTRRGLRPRKDFMVQALDNKQSEIKAAIMASLQNAIRTA